MLKNEKNPNENEKDIQVVNEQQKMVLDVYDFQKMHLKLGRNASNFAKNTKKKL